MKVAVSSSGRDLESPIDPRFGRCACFINCDVEDMSFEAFDNENMALGGGAGIQSAQFVASKGANAVITRNCGPNAVKTLAAAGVQLFVGQSGAVREAIERFKRNEPKPTTEANVSDHFGMQGSDVQSRQQVQTGLTDQAPGRGMGMGSGRGSGRGMGCGRGMGMGQGGGMGRGRGMSSVRTTKGSHRKNPSSG
ncbi:MAG: NifB/NifX family molybdenum-iron cluster-binding protein [Pseudomonadota bacterium]